MAREIKFRAWDKQNKNMQFPLHRDFAWLGETVLEDEKRYSVMQYTGLKDKNGKEIYEGDIIKQIYHGWVEEVVWDSYGYFTFKDNTDIRNILGLVVPQYWQIIGNIYENPELLKELA